MENNFVTKKAKLNWGKSTKGLQKMTWALRCKLTLVWLGKTMMPELSLNEDWLRNAVQCIFWSIWLERNSRIFYDTSLSNEQCWEKINFRAAFWTRKHLDFTHLAVSDLVRDWSFTYVWLTYSSAVIADILSAFFSSQTLPI